MWDSEDIISGLGMLILGWGYTGRWEPMVLVLVGVVGLVVVCLIEWLSPFYRRYRTSCRKA